MERKPYLFTNSVLIASVRRSLDPCSSEVDCFRSLLTRNYGFTRLGCLQDLQRFLRRDDLETKAFHVQLGNWGVLAAHLLPMLTAHRDNFEIVFELCTYSHQSAEPFPGLFYVLCAVIRPY